MKKLILFIAIAVAATQVQAQELKPVLTKTFNMFDSSQNKDFKTEQANKLELIAKKWSNEWITHYYLSLSKTILTHYETDPATKDANLDIAEKEHEEAVSILGKENDETYVLAAMIASARMSVDPMTRWQKYGQIFTENLQNAKEINPDNPRMYYIQGTSKYFTPKAYGGGKKAAKPYFEKAATLFAKEKTDYITKPYWGRYANAYFIGQCNIEDKQ